MASKVAIQSSKSALRIGQRRELSQLANAQFSHPVKLSSTQISRSSQLHSKQSLQSSFPTSPCMKQSTSQKTGCRSFSSTPVRPYKTVEEAKMKYRTGPFSFTAGAVFIISGAGLWFYFKFEKERMERRRVAESHKGVGKPLVGGAFSLVDQNGNVRTDKDLTDGKFMLVYFGFTHCPDICPDELDKMGQMLDLVEKEHGKTISPLFITCDPHRDNPKVLKVYLDEFHPSMIGLTGTYDDIKNVCRRYRVYFSTPRDLKEGMDYLVDHSIYFYLMDPDGNFVEALGRQHTAEQAAKIINAHMGDWITPLKPYTEPASTTSISPQKE